MRYLLLSIALLSNIMAAPSSSSSQDIENSGASIPNNNGVDFSYLVDQVQDRQQENIVPMVVINESDLPAVSYRPARPNTVQRNQDWIGSDKSEKPYKHMGMGIGFIKVAPLLPQDQMELGFQREQWVASFLAEDQQPPSVLNETTETRKLKQMLGLSDKGETQTVDVPEYDNKSVVSAVTHKLSEQIEKIYPEGISEKKLVGVDQDGLMRFVNVPHYDRESDNVTRKKELSV